MKLLTDSPITCHAFNAIVRAGDGRGDTRASNDHAGNAQKQIRMVAEEKTPDRGDYESEYDYREGASGVGCCGATSSWEQTRCAIDTG